MANSGEEGRQGEGQGARKQERLEANLWVLGARLEVADRVVVGEEVRTAVGELVGGRAPAEIRWIFCTQAGWDFYRPG